MGKEDNEAIGTFNSRQVLLVISFQGSFCMDGSRCLYFPNLPMCLHGRVFARYLYGGHVGKYDYRIKPAAQYINLLVICSIMLRGV